MNFKGGRRDLIIVMENLKSSDISKFKINLFSKRMDSINVKSQAPSTLSV